MSVSSMKTLRPAALSASASDWSAARLREATTRVAPDEASDLTRARPSRPVPPNWMMTFPVREMTVVDIVKGSDAASAVDL
jgi:hypothetical protein